MQATLISPLCDEWKFMILDTNNGGSLSQIKMALESLFNFPPKFGCAAVRNRMFGLEWTEITFLADAPKYVTLSHLTAACTCLLKASLIVFLERQQIKSQKLHTLRFERGVTSVYAYLWLTVPHQSGKKTNQNLRDKIDTTEPWNYLESHLSSHGRGSHWPLTSAISRTSLSNEHTLQKCQVAIPYIITIVSKIHPEELFNH